MKLRIVLTPALAAAILLLAGCHHAGKVTHAAPPALPEVGPVMVSVPPPTHHDQPEMAVAATPASIPSPEPTRRPSRPARRNAAAPPAAAATPPTGVTVATAAPPISLGELSAGGETSSGLRQQTADLLKSQQQRLDGMNKTVLATHPTEIAQAKTFLQRANTSWNAADYEGAHTLVVKAKVLLDDLKQ